MKRKIEKMALETSSVGMGCWAIGGEWDFLGSAAGWGKTDDKESIKAIEAAYDNGIRIFDTAATYGCGHSERLVGETLKGKRDDSVIVTKFGFDVHEQSKKVENYGDSMDKSIVVPHLKRDCENSLKRLGTDYIDIFLLHIWDYDLNLANELMIALEELVDEGKIRSYGWSTDDCDSIKSWTPGKNFSAIMNNYNVASDAPELISICEENKLTALNKAPLAMGFLTGKYNMDSKFTSTDVRSAQWVDDVFRVPVLEKLDELREVMTSGGRTLTQGALAWIWAKSQCTLPTPGIRTAKQAVEIAEAMNYGAFNISELNQIEEIMGRLTNAH